MGERKSLRDQLTELRQAKIAQFKADLPKLMGKEPKTQTDFTPPQSKEEASQSHLGGAVSNTESGSPQPEMPLPKDAVSGNTTEHPEEVPPTPTPTAPGDGDVDVSKIINQRKHRGKRGGKGGSRKERGDAETLAAVPVTASGGDSADQPSKVNEPVVARGADGEAPEKSGEAQASVVAGAAAMAAAGLAGVGSKMRTETETKERPFAVAPTRSEEPQGAIHYNVPTGIPTPREGVEAEGGAEAKMEGKEREQRSDKPIGELEAALEKARQEYAEVMVIKDKEEGMLARLRKLLPLKQNQEEISPSRNDIEKYREAYEQCAMAVQLKRLDEAGAVSYPKAREAALRETLRYSQVNEFQKLYRTRVEAKLAERQKTVGGRIVTGMEKFFGWYAKQPLKTKLAVAAGMGLVAVGTGTMSGIGLAVIGGRYVLSAGSTATAYNALAERLMQWQRTKSLDKALERTIEGAQDESETLSPEQVTEKYKKALNDITGSSADTVERWMKQDRVRKLASLAGGAITGPALGRLLGMAWDNHIDKVGLKPFTADTAKFPEGFRFANIPPTPEAAAVASQPDTASVVLADNPGPAGPGMASTGGPAPVESAASVPSAPNVVEAPKLVNAKAVAEFLSKRTVDPGDSLWRYSANLGQQLNVPDPQRFAASVEQAIREKIASHPELLEKAGFINEDLHLGAGKELNLHQVLSTEELQRLAEAPEVKGVPGVLENSNQAPKLESAFPSAESTSPADMPRAEHIPVEPVKLVDVTGEAAVPDERITFADEVPNPPKGESGILPQAEAAEVASVESTTAKAPDITQPGITDAEVYQYYKSLPAAERGMIDQKFAHLSKQLLELNVNRVFTGDMPDTRLFNPNYNPRIFSAEVTTVLDNRFFATTTQNPLHSSQFERLKMLVEFAQSKDGFGAAGAPRPRTELMPGERLREYLIRLSALSHKTGIPLPRLN